MQHVASGIQNWQLDLWHSAEWRRQHTFLPFVEALGLRRCFVNPSGSRECGLGFRESVLRAGTLPATVDLEPVASIARFTRLAPLMVPESCELLST